MSEDFNSDPYWEEEFSVWEKEFRKLEALCEQFDIKDRAKPLMELFFDPVNEHPETNLKSYAVLYQDIISMCDAILAIRGHINYFSMTLGSKKVEFSSNCKLQGLIDYDLNKLLIIECFNSYHRKGGALMDDNLFRIYEAHTEIIEVQEGVCRESHTKLTDKEIRFIKKTYEKYLDLEKKLEGSSKAEGYNTKNAKLGWFAINIMEKLPEDMEHKHLFVAEFLMASGALAYRGESWIESFLDKSPNEKEHQVRLWISKYDSFRQDNIGQ